jgi:hypothetical protein
MKQTEDPPKQIKREYIWVFCRKFRVVSVCFGLLRNRSVCFGCFDIGSKHIVFCFTKQTETNAKQISFRFVLVRNKIYFCLFRGHPSEDTARLHLGSGDTAHQQGGGGVGLTSLSEDTARLHLGTQSSSKPAQQDSRQNLNS